MDVKMFKCCLIVTTVIYLIKILIVIIVWELWCVTSVGYITVVGVRILIPTYICFGILTVTDLNLFDYGCQDLFFILIVATVIFFFDKANQINRS